MPKQIVIIRMEGKGKKGRPWKMDRKKLKGIWRARGIINWHAVTGNWKEWRKIVMEAKVKSRMKCLRRRIR